MHKLKKSKERRVSRTYLGLGLITAPAVVSGVVLSSASAMAGDSVVDNVSITVPVSCSVSARGMDSHTATIANGIYTTDIGTTTMKITCNDSEGFSIYAAGFTGNQVGETDSTKLIGTAISNYATIDTGTTTGSSADDDSSWAMKLESGYGTYSLDIVSDYADYYYVPNGYAQVAYRQSGTDVGVGAEGSTLTTTYAAYIAKGQTADTYAGKVKYTLVHPNDAATPVDTALYLQETDDIAAAVPNVGDTVNALDARDGTEYTVGRLADGNVWLLDNLALNLTMPNASEYITDQNTNASSDSLEALFNGVEDGGSGGNLARAAVVSSDSFSDTYTVPVINPEFRNMVMSDISSISAGIDSGWTVGTYYNYCAASAGSYCYDDESGDGDATEDICPAGWRMPSVSTDYYALNNDYFGYEAFRGALRIPLAGYNYFMDNDTYPGSGVGTTGYHWGSDNPSSYSEMDSYEFGASSGNSNSASRYYGYSVRCIMDAD